MDGTLFGRYRLIELLGRGGMGEVWRAHDTVTDRVVAIKVLPANLSEDEDFQRRFRREAHAAARLDTPHVVPIYDYGEIDGRLFVSMRLINGRDLDAVLADGPLDPARAVRIIDQVAKALHAAHQVGLMHRDIKPSNILLDDDDFAYLIDFGIARVADETRLTKSGNTIGTFAYIAPERLDPHTDEDARADIYSLACVLYEALTGKPPFAGSTTPHLIAAHLNTPPPRPSTTQPDVPAQFDAVIARGMAKDRDQRYATTVELADAAREAITVPISRPTPTPAPDQAVARAPNPVTAEPTVTEDESPQPPPSAFASVATQHRREQQPPAYAGQLGSAATEHADWANQQPTQLAPPQSAQPTKTGVRQLSGRTKIALIVGTVAVVAIVVAVVLATVLTSGSSNASQVVLPFTGLHNPDGVAVDSAGNVYVADRDNNRVVKLAAGSTTQTVLPFTGLNEPEGVAVDSAGNVYSTDQVNNRVVKLAAGSTTQTVLPFTGLAYPDGVAVDSAGNLYVVDSANSRVVKLAAGSTTQEVLPFTGLSVPIGVAVDSAGTVYVADNRNRRVVKLAAGSTTPLTGFDYPRGVAVDSTDNVYVADNRGVVKLAAGYLGSTQTVLPFNEPHGVAVDSAGNVYATDLSNNRVLKLPAK